MTKGFFPYNIDFTIPGFEKSYPPYLFKCLSFTDRPSEEWFLNFKQKVEDNIGKSHFPLYRMSDGEFEFCVGYRFPRPACNEPLSLYVLRSLKRLVGRIKCKIFSKTFLSAGGVGYNSGDYFINEISSLRKSFVEQLRQISAEGALCVHLTDRVFSNDKMQFQQQYFRNIIDWFLTNKIDLNINNYFPFYFVYALLLGPFRECIYRDRSILVITSYDDAKRDAITKGLINEGVQDIQFIPISSRRSMFDKIDITNVKRPIDVILVGGGIGASNILCQVKALNTVAIDAGVVIECLANPSRKKHRTFCWPDEERGGDYRPI